MASQIDKLINPKELRKLVAAVETSVAASGAAKITADPQWQALEQRITRLKEPFLEQREVFMTHRETTAMNMDTLRPLAGGKLFEADKNIQDANILMDSTVGKPEL